MCSLCEENDGEMECCQYCSKLVCFDVKFGDDICQPACVTSGGDLACVRCASEIERDEEEREDYDYYAPYPDWDVYDDDTY